ncbi:MAG TPA: hypothetical protein VF891_03660 [Gaiellaceae bacterium]
MPSPERQATYLVALQARLDDQTLDVTPREFSDSQLLPQDQPAFIERMLEYGLEPDSAFQKDLSLVRTAKFRVVFEHGMVLLAARDDVAEQRLRIEDAADGANVRINDTIRRLEGR